MTVFVDTSACYALVSATDQDHPHARDVYRQLVDRAERLVTTSYVLAESMGLIQHRLGWKPLELFAAAVATWDVTWVDAVRHRAAVAVLSARRRPGIISWMPLALP